ncbi:MAG: efflux RND transporter permease subunit, partial [Chloroflexota bacterium]
LEPLKARLPTDATDPVVLRFDPSAQPVLVYSVGATRGQMAPRELRRLTDDVLKPRLERLDGVGQVRVQGGEEREVQVNLNLDALKARNLAVQEISRALSDQNLSLPGGRVTEANQDLLVKTTGQFQSVEQVQNVVVAQRNGAKIYLRDVAEVVDGSKERRVFNRLNGQDGVTVTVVKQSGSNTIHVADGVTKEFERIRKDYPALDLVKIRDESKQVKESNQDVTVALALGAIFASLVVLLFFRDLRNTLVTVAGLPVIILGTFWVISNLGFTINMLTLMALSLSIGLLVDDAIVVRENIFRHMEAGAEPRDAAARGTKEVAFAVLATTLTIMAVFIPVAFTSGIIGQFFRQFGITVAVAAAISLLEAFTLAPMLSAYFFKRIDRVQHEEQRSRARTVKTYVWFFGWYRKVLEWSLGHRKWVSAGAAAFFIASIGLVPFLGVQFFGTSDTGQFGVSLQLPPGTSLEETDFMTRYVEDALRRESAVADVYTTVGGSTGFFASSSPEVASLFVSLKADGKTTQFVDRMRESLGNIPGISFSNQAVGGDSGATGLTARQVLMSVQGGESIGDIQDAAQQLADRLSKVPGAVDVDTSFKLGKPELHITVDQAKAADLGVNTTLAAATVRTLLTGETPTKLREGDRQTDIVVRLRAADRQRSADVLSMSIPSKGGQTPLSTTVQMTAVQGPTQIDRVDRQPRILVGANAKGRPESEITRAAQQIITDLSLPAGAKVAFAGNAQSSQESFGALLSALLLAIVFVYMVLASQFGSFLHPFTIMLSLPLAFGGAFMGLLVFRKPLDVMGMIGIIMLMGLVTKNAILLIDFVLQARRSGMPRHDAVLQAGVTRLRPILMTTLAMIAGMLPVALGITGPGSGWRSPMAITVVGGLITSTLLTLVVVPVVYTLLDDIQQFVVRRRTRAAPRERAERVPVLTAEGARD